MQDKLREIEKQYEVDTDNYTTTINVIVCFSHAVLWDDSAESMPNDYSFTPGRKMDTSQDNPVSPDEIVTPDIVILKEKRSGIIAEIKHGLSRNNGNWDKVIRQLEKYDDNLKGWRGVEDGDINHDLVILIPYRFGVDFSDYLAEKILDDSVNFKRNIACITFTRESKASTFCTFEKKYGSLSDKIKDDQLRRVYPIPMHVVCPLYTLIFCDEKPPVPYTMERIWGHLVNFKEMDVLSGSKGKEIVFTSEMLVEGLKRENFVHKPDDRTPELPRTSWIREALNEMSDLKIFKKDKESGEYAVSYYKYERMKDPLGHFIHKLAEKEAVAEEVQTQHEQLSLI